MRIIFVSFGSQSLADDTFRTKFESTGVKPCIMGVRTISMPGVSTAHRARCAACRTTGPRTTDARTANTPKLQGFVAFRHVSMQHQRLTRCRIGMRCDSRVFSLASSPVCVCRLCGRMLCWDRFLLRSLDSRRTAFRKGIFSQRALVRTARARSSRPRSNRATPAHCRRGRSVRASRWSSGRVPWHHRAALRAVRRSRPRQTTRSSPRFRRLSHER